jgi:hypothetical protein
LNLYLNNNATNVMKVVFNVLWMKINVFHVETNISILKIFNVKIDVKSTFNIKNSTSYHNNFYYQYTKEPKVIINLEK